jgi:rhodanese-related sulfurtransferase
MNPYGAPEITVKEVEARQAAGDQFIWLDVREPNEHAAVSIDDERILLTPLSRLATEQLAALAGGGSTPGRRYHCHVPPRQSQWSSHHVVETAGLDQRAQHGRRD